MTWIQSGLELCEVLGQEVQAYGQWMSSDWIHSVLWGVSELVINRSQNIDISYFTSNSTRRIRRPEIVAKHESAFFAGYRIRFLAYSVSGHIHHVGSSCHVGSTYRPCLVSLKSLNDAWPSWTRQLAWLDYKQQSWSTYHLLQLVQRLISAMGCWWLVYDSSWSSSKMLIPELFGTHLENLAPLLSLEYALQQTAV